MNGGRRLHPAAFARAASGIALLAWPQAIVAFAGGEPPARRWVIAARVLGARHLIEAAAVNAEPRAGFAWAGAGVDAVHALTAAGVAAYDDERRRMLLANFLGALGFALAGAHHARVLARSA